jgi:hypothetical protein
MAYVEMDVAPAQRVFQYKHAYEKSSSVSAVVAGEWILIPADVTQVVCTVNPGVGCSVKVEATSDLVSVVKSGSPVAIPWASGVVTGATQDVCVPVTAVRINQTIGTNASTLTVRAQ